MRGQSMLTSVRGINQAWPTMPASLPSLIYAPINTVAMVGLLTIPPVMEWHKDTQKMRNIHLFLTLRWTQLLILLSKRMGIWVKSLIDLLISQFPNSILLLLTHVLQLQLEKPLKAASRQLKQSNILIMTSSVEKRSTMRQNNREYIYLSLPFLLFWVIPLKHCTLALLQFNSSSCPIWRMMGLLYRAHWIMTLRIRWLFKDLNRFKLHWVTAILSKLTAAEYSMA